jgi:hypothetical protein
VAAWAEHLDSHARRVYGTGVAYSPSLNVFTLPTHSPLRLDLAGWQRMGELS